MAIERWRPRWGHMRGGPWRELARMEQEMEEALGRPFFAWPWFHRGDGGTWTPSVDLLDRKEDLIDAQLVKVLAWYDSEWGYSCRVRDLVQYIARSGP